MKNKNKLSIPGNCIVIMLLINSAVSLQAQTNEVINQPEILKGMNREFDHVINAAGESRVTLATGIPYIGVAEYAWFVKPGYCWISCGAHAGC